MSNRTAGIIDAEIDAIKVNNPNWLADIGDKALITALTVEKNQLAPPAQPGNYLILCISLCYLHRIFYISVFYLRLMR